MDQVKTGKFIAEMRKSKNLTQKQLAEKLNISDKAVSKWECGKSMPDNALLLNLCDALDINVNELLSGEKLSKDDYHGKAEENMMNLINESNKKATTSTPTLVLSFIGLFIAFYSTIAMMNGSIYWFIDMVSLMQIIIFTVIIMILSGSVKDFFYSYKICYGKSTDISHEQVVRSYAAFKLTFISILLSGGISTLIGAVGVIGLLANKDYSNLGPNLAVASLTVLYALILDLCLLPLGKTLYVKLHKK